MTLAMLSIEGLSLHAGSTPIVCDADLSVGEGRIVALVGESGSGKTMISRSVMGLLPPGVAITGGSIRFQGQNLVDLSAEEWRLLRGRDIGMVFQEPMVSLNPAMRIGSQIKEAARLHKLGDEREIHEKAIEMLERFQISEPEKCLRQFPHEFSGGMRQRVLLAGVMMMRPRLLIADEPTTALDAIVQQEVLDLMISVARDASTSVLLVTHDLAVVHKYADDIVVINRGKVEERGEARALLSSPRTEYTRRLVAAMPAGTMAPAAEAIPDHALRVENLRVEFRSPSSIPFKPARKTVAVDEVSFAVGRGEFFGLVGGSGSGKTTTGRAILGLTQASEGKIWFEGVDLTSVSRGAFRPLRSKIQLVFQDPYSSLNPRRSVRKLLSDALWREPAEHVGRRVSELMQDVELDPALLERMPHQLSGGQRQRVAIARALACRPDFLVADEPVSALDVTVQARILESLVRLRDKYGFGCLFISHDLAVVRAICERVAVMQSGRIVEFGETRRVLQNPEHEYTRRLISAFPTIIPGTSSGAPAQDRKLGERI